MSASATATSRPTAPPRRADRARGGGRSHAAAAARFVTRIRRDPLWPLVEEVRAQGPVARMEILGSVFFVVADADVARHVLVANQDNWPKAPEYGALQVILGKGLVTSSGELWRRQRKLVQPMFAKRHLAPFATHMVAAAQDTLGALGREHADGEVVDAAAEMNALTLDVIGRALFGARLGGDARAVGEAMTVVLRGAVSGARSPFVRLASGLPGVSFEQAFHMNPRRSRSTRAGVQVLADVVDRLADARLADPDAPADDLLALLLSARDEETGEGMSRQQVQDELVTFLAAGHETTANALAWTLMLLSQHPDVREQLHAEVDAVLAGGAPGFDAPEVLPFTFAVFQESMRLYPPVWSVSRQAVEADELGGRAVPAGATAIVMPFLVHRDPAIWENPEGFDPRRWLDGAPARPRHAYLPFGGGRRVCVASGFALMEGVMLLAMIAQRFEFDLVAGARVIPEATITLRPRDGIPMTVRSRTPG